MRSVNEFGIHEFGIPNSQTQKSMMQADERAKTKLKKKKRRRKTKLTFINHHPIL